MRLEVVNGIEVELDQRLRNRAWMDSRCFLYLWLQELESNL
jgi:hypothetical protein